MAEAIPTSVEQLLIASSAGRGPYKLAVKAGSTVNLTLSGEQTVGGVACVENDRVLAAGQTDPKKNGIWIVKVGPWVRATDHDSDRDCTLGARVEVLNGTAKGMWHMTAPTTGTVTPNVTAQTWTKDDPASIQGPDINIGTEPSNVTIDIGNGADAITLDANDIDLRAANILALAAPTMRLGGAAASDRLTVSGASSIITADVPDGTIFNVRSDVFGIYEAAQAVPSFVFSSDADAASSLTFGSGTTVTIGQSQSLSGAGRTLTIRGQQGQAGQVGGDLIISPGLGGTAGANAPGNIKLRVGAQAGGQTGHVLLTDESSGDTDFLRMRRVGTATYLESLAGDLNLSATAAAQVIATTTMVFRGTSAFFDADTVYWRSNGLTQFWTEVRGTVQATTATTSVVASFATTSNRVYLVEAFFTGSNDTDNQGTAFTYQAAFKNVAGTVTQIGTAAAINKFRDAGSAGHDAGIDFSGTTIRGIYATTDTDTVNINCVMRVYERVLV